jgi:LysM repeat protein
MAATQKLNSMRYKSFTWEYNPTTCTYSCQRSYVAHKYPELAGVEIEDMDTNEVVITGKGEFFGPNAYKNWLKLNAEFRTFGSGSFYHPIFTDVTQALMTKLQADMEPRDDYVAYSFEIISDTSINEINTPSVIVSNNNASSSRQIKVGDMVTLTGYAYYDSWGRTPRSGYKNGVKYTVTYTNYKGTHPIHCGSLGWCRLEDVKLSVASSESPFIVVTSDMIHVVKSGESLSGICKKYGADWRKVASYNNIKDPNKIYVGQKIKIPKSMMSQSTISSGASGTKNTTSSSSSKVTLGTGRSIRQIIMPK